MAEAELDAIALAAAERQSAIERLVGRLRSKRAWRKLLLKDGKLTGDGLTALADLARVTSFGKALPDGSHAELAFREGQRSVLLHILARLDAKSLRALSEQLNQKRNDTDE